MGGKAHCIGILVGICDVRDEIGQKIIMTNS